MSERDSYLCEKCGYEVRVLTSESNQHEYDAHRMDGAYWFPEDDRAESKRRLLAFLPGVVIADQTEDGARVLFRKGEKEHWQASGHRNYFHTVEVADMAGAWEEVSASEWRDL